MSLEQQEERIACKPSRWMMLKAKLKNISPEEFRTIINTNTDSVLIDTRTAAEYQQIHLKKAINIDYLKVDMWEQVEALEQDKTYLLYCRSGRRSIRLGTLMRNSGFDTARIFNLEGGISAWRAAFGDEYLVEREEVNK